MTADRRSGTQSIARAADLLKALGTRKTIGWRLTDLAAHCGLDDSTAHRIMSCLASLRLAHQRPMDRRYVPGPMLFELALGLPAYFDLQAACHKSLVGLVRKTGWTAFLYLRSGDESVCLDRVGASARPPAVDVGTRRPLAGSAMGVAMLLALPKPEQKAVLASSLRKVRSVPAHRGRAYNRMWRRSLAEGMALNLGDIFPSTGSMAVAILDARKQPFAAIGVAGPLGEFSRERIAEVKQWLLSEARRIEREQSELINA